MIQRILFLGAVVLCMAGPVTALAQTDTTSQARALFNAGAQAYESGKYPAAIQAFQEAYRLSPREGLLFSIAQAHRRQYFISRDPADLHAAIEHYQKYLEVARESKRRGEAADALTQLEPMLARLGGGESSDRGEDVPASPSPSTTTQIMVTSPTKGAHLRIDAKEVGELPYIASVQPGLRRVAVVAPGFRTYEREIKIAKGSIVPLDVELEPEPALLTVRTKKRAQIIANGRVLGTTPLSKPVALPPGEYTISIVKNGHRLETRELVLGRGDSEEVTVRLRRSTQRRLAYVTLAVGGVTFLSGTSLAASAADQQDQAEALLERQKNKNLSEADAERYEELRSERDRLRMAALTSTSVGVAIGAVGALLFILDRPDAQEGENPRPKIIPAFPRRKPVSTDLAVLSDGHHTFATLRGRF